MISFTKLWQKWSAIVKEYLKSDALPPAQSSLTNKGGTRVRILIFMYIYCNGPGRTGARNPGSEPKSQNEAQSNSTVFLAVLPEFGQPKDRQGPFSICSKIPQWMEGVKVEFNSIMGDEK